MITDKLRKVHGGVMFVSGGKILQKSSNTVVGTGYAHIMKSLATSITHPSVTRAALGSSPGDTTYDMTQLGHELPLQFTLQEVVQTAPSFAPSDGHVLYMRFSMNSPLQAEGYKIAEVGLFVNTNVLFSRAVFEIPFIFPAGISSCDLYWLLSSDTPINEFVFYRVFDKIFEA